MTATLVSSHCRLNLLSYLVIGCAVQAPSSSGGGSNGGSAAHSAGGRVKSQGLSTCFSASHCMQHNDKLTCCILVGYLQAARDMAAAKALLMCGSREMCGSTHSSSTSACVSMPAHHRQHKAAELSL